MAKSGLKLRYVLHQGTCSYIGLLVSFNLLPYKVGIIIWCLQIRERKKSQRGEVTPPKHKITSWGSKSQSLVDCVQSPHSSPWRLGSQLYGNSWEHKTDSSNIAVCVSQTRDYGGVTLRESYSTLLGWSVLPKSWLLLASTWTEWVKSLSSVWTLEASQAAVD